MSEVTVQTRLPRLDEAGRAALFTEAHTANTFAARPVTDAELASIWDLAKWPPTAVNSQPLRALYVQGGDARKRLVAHLAEGNKAKTLTAPAVAVLAYDGDFHEHLPAVYPPKPELKEVFARERRPARGDGQGRSDAAGLLLPALGTRARAGGRADGRVRRRRRGC